MTGHLAHRWSTPIKYLLNKRMHRKGRESEFVILNQSRPCDPVRSSKEVAQKVFTPEDVWHGGFFELSIEIGDRCDDRINAAVQTLWENPKLAGCYLDRNTDPDIQKPVRPPLVTDEDWCHTYGIADFNGRDIRLACGSCVVREFNGPDWLDFYFPMGAIGRLFSVGGFPFIDRNESVPWLPRVESWLAELGLWLATRIPIQMGLIGFECSGSTDLATLTQENGIPAERWNGYILPTRGAFEYVPSNAYKT